MFLHFKVDVFFPKIIRSRKVLDFPKKPQFMVRICTKMYIGSLGDKCR